MNEELENAKKVILNILDQLKLNKEERTLVYGAWEKVVLATEKVKEC